jgi:hypothetical protein
MAPAEVQEPGQHSRENVVAVDVMVLQSRRDMQDQQPHDEATRAASDQDVAGLPVEDSEDKAKRYSKAHLSGFLRATAASFWWKSAMYGFTTWYDPRHVGYKNSAG